MLDHVGWYFTAPWDPIPIRRGDALGLRAGADYFADLLAPGLSNSTSDARWISILSWCLKWSHITWQRAGGGDLSQRDAQRARYAWLRPLELLWIERALISNQEGGQLRGVRSVRRWRSAWARENRWLPNFGMSADQFRRYRQTGSYGAYRVVFRNVEGLTTGDGFTPGSTALALADLVNDSLPRSARLDAKQFDGRTKWGHWGAGNEVQYWIEHWRASREAPGGYLPTPAAEFGRRLPEDERDLLEPCLFPHNSVRRLVAEALASATEAGSHTDLCTALALSDALAGALAPASLAALPAFTQLADASMHAMRGLWAKVHRDGDTSTPTVASLAESEDLRERMAGLRLAADRWLIEPTRTTFPHERVSTELASSMLAATTTVDQLRALARHHHSHGGGRRWFREEADKFVPLLSDTGVEASDYRFRLTALTRLAAQCGLRGMQSALMAVTRNELDGTSDDDLDDQDGGPP
jgi:hypothetical protein